MATSNQDEATKDKKATTFDDFMRMGWSHKANGELDEAEEYFRKAISLKPESVEAYYGLGLTLKAQDRRQDSIQSFEKVLGLLDVGIDDRVRGEMLRRLSLAHINLIKSGDWGLEKEIWKHK